MRHVYFSLIADKEELSLDSKFTIYKNGDRECFVPIIHVQSDDKAAIRKELINSIDNMLKHI